LNNYKIEISYDGTNFHGFQKQKNIRTVQSVIETSLSKILTSYQLLYSGRTDAGVHAKSQVLSLRTCELLDQSFLASLDSLLSEDIKVKKIKKVNQSFNPRYDAKSRTYKYFVQEGRNAEPYFRNYRHITNSHLDIDKLNSLSKHFLGKNNFTNFSKLRKDQDPIREITKSKWSRINNSFIYTIEGNSFLHNMVRSIVGCQLAALDGKIYKKQLIDALKNPLELRFNYVAPANGLYLWKIKY
tara:strand:+ start:136 stop:861 length:726 start_codon:yes stop_codon:yes gene_type:complete